MIPGGARYQADAGPAVTWLRAETSDGAVLVKQWRWEHARDRQRELRVGLVRKGAGSGGHSSPSRDAATLSRSALEIYMLLPFCSLPHS
jgi:hypothetical protein